MAAVRRLTILMITVAACSEPTGPLPGGGPLTGSWGTLPIPSGAFTLLSLNSGAGRLAGTAQQWGIADAYLGSYPLAGTYSETDRSLRLWLMHGLVSAATFVGRWSADSLVGTWAQQGGSWSMSFARQVGPTFPGIAKVRQRGP